METEPLEVRQLDSFDVFKDMARVHESQRGNIPVGTICKVSIGSQTRYLSIRGLPNDVLESRRLPVNNPRYILLDDVSRRLLNVELQSIHRFKIEPASWCGRLF